MGVFALASGLEVHDDFHNAEFSKYHFWGELSDQQRRTLSDPREEPLFRVICGLSRKDKVRISCCLVPFDLHHYCVTQEPWIFKAKEYVANELHIPLEQVSESDQLIPNLTKYGTPINFRLYYAARFPNKIGIKDNASEGDLQLVKDFYSDCRHALTASGLDFCLD